MNLSNYSTWIAIIGFIGIGIINTFLLFRKEKFTIDNTADKAADRLIINYKLITEQQDHKIRVLEEQQRIQLEKFGQLAGRNEILEALLTGRDKESEEMKRNAVLAMQQINEIHQDMKKLYQVIADHLKIIREKV